MVKNVFKFPGKVLEPVKDFLLNELKKVKKRRKKINKDDPFKNEDRVDDNAANDFEADEQFGHARAKAVSTQLDRKIIQIKKALARIKIGQYGICEKCNNFINTERLMVYPETTYCVKCQSKTKKS